jgi:hypothetical protein
MEQVLIKSGRANFMFDREPMLYNNDKAFFASQPDTVVNIIQLGSSHVEKISGSYRGWDPTMARLIRNKDINSYTVFALINPKDKKYYTNDLSKAYRKELRSYRGPAPAPIKTSDISEDAKAKLYYDYLIVMP